MKAATRWFRLGWLLAGLLLFAVSGARAQESPAAARPAGPAHESPPPDQLEPGVNTSPQPAPAAAPAHVAKPTPATPPAAPADGARQAAGTDTATRPTQGTPAPPSAQQKAGAQAPKSGAGAGKAQDRLELDTTQITGNRELPKVLYIVPWKRSDLGDLIGKPVNSLLDEVLSPVDRDVFKRENRYYDALKPDQAKAATGAAQGAGEKH
jgi:hypothetical protein